MLQTIAVWILQNYLGEYVENLNADQLSIGYGGIELENLYLKRSALKNLKFPIKLISGVIGRLKLVIPYRNPNTQPWVIQIEQLNLVTEADPEANLEEDSKDKLEQLKKKRLAELEAELKASLLSSEQGGWFSSSSWFPSITSSFSTKIVENLQLDIKDVHIRYSTSETCAFGISINSLTAQSTNKDWEKSFQTTSSELKYKLLELNGLSIYYDNKHVNYDAFKLDSLGSASLFGPINAEARITKNASKAPLTVKDGPRFQVNVSLDDLTFTLSDGQYRTIVGIADDVNRYFKSLGHSKYRPKVSVKQSPQAWWKFAIKSVLDPIKEQNTQCTKEFILQRLKDINVYNKEYKEHILITDDTVAKDMTLINEIESRMCYEELAILRRIAFFQVNKEKRNIKKPLQQMDSNNSTNLQQKSGQSWSAWAMSFNPYASVPDSDNTGQAATTAPSPKKQLQPDLTVTEEEKKFLDDLRNSYNQEEDLILNQDAILTQLSFTLQTGSLVLTSDTRQKEIVNISLQHVDFTMEIGSKLKSISWNISLRSFVVKNLSSNSKTFPALIQPQKEVDDDPTNDDEDFIQISFTKKEGTRKSMFKVDVLLQPSNVVIDSAIITDVKEFFIIPDHSKYKLMTTTMSQRFRQAVDAQLEGLREATKTEFENVMTQITKGNAKEEDEWNVNLNIAAPQIIIPLQNHEVNYQIRDKMMIFNLGRIIFHNIHAKALQNVNSGLETVEEEEEDEDEFLTPSSTSPASPADDSGVQPKLKDFLFDNTLTENEIREMFYDSYTLELNSVQILVSNITENWMTKPIKGFGPDHVVDQFSVAFDFKRRTVFTADPEYPALTLSGVLPQLLVHIDEIKLQVIFSCLSIFSSKPDDVPPPLTPAVSPSPSAETITSSSTDVSQVKESMDDLLVESRLMLAKFTFEKISLGLHSRGRCFAELQVDGVECELTKRPYDTSVSFILSSLLLIDAIQAFGPEFELLVSSKSLQNEKVQSEEALIHINYHMISEECPSLGNNESSPVQFLTANFNSLHINGNLETIVELNNVLHQVISASNNSVKKKQLNIAQKDNNPKTIDLNKTVQGKKIDITASFKSIDVLLLRTITQDFVRYPQKVANITMRDLELTAAIREGQNVSGSIGNIMITDLSPTAFVENQIFNVGDQTRVNKNFEAVQALSFSCTDFSEEKEGRLVSIHMASAYYIHNPLFLQELSLCAGDFKQYAINIAKSLQTAASDMAISIVSSRTTLDQRSSNQEFFESTPSHRQSVPKQNKKSSYQLKTFYKASIETPVVVLPRDENFDHFIVGHLGKITLHNEYITTDNFIDRLVLDFENINLSVVNLNMSELGDQRDIFQFFSPDDNNSQQIQIIHNTDLHIEADKCIAQPSLHYLPSEHTESKNLIHLQCSINSPLKLFLSVPIYKQILSTLTFISTKVDNKVSSSAVTSGATSPILSPRTSSGDMWKSSLMKNRPATPTVPDVQVTNPSTDITANFSLPTLQIELHGELHGKTHGFVNIVFDHFQASYSNVLKPFQSIRVTLQDFSIEDLLYEKQDKFRYLVSSANNKDVSFFSRERPCSSYPEKGDLVTIQKLSKSLPSVLVEEDSLDVSSSTSIATLTKGNSRINVGPLISLEITIADENSDDISSYQKRKNISVDVNTIDLVINLQTWVILLDFFGIGAAQNQASSPRSSEQDVNFDEKLKGSQVKLDVPSQTDLNINIKSVVVYLNKEHYPLAEASLNYLCLNMVLADGNQDVDGSIGSIKLLDLSPTGTLYRERLTSHGDRAFHFSFFRFGAPDPNLERAHDMDLNLTMCAIQYVHTQRFLMETIAFCQHFILLQEVLGRMRAVSAGDEVRAVLNRAARLNLKVHSESPILILPRSWSSNDLLVANLGKLNIENSFLYASNPKTNGYKFNASRSRNVSGNDLDSPDSEYSNRLLDCISIKLTDMQVLSALRVEKEEATFLYVEQGNAMMPQPCILDLTIERNLEWMFGRQVPDMSITGSLSSVYLCLDLSQFSLIMSMLGENLGEPLATFEAPSTHLIDPLIMGSPTKQLWTTMHVKLHLSNVTIEASPRFSFGNIPSSKDAAEHLAKFDFIQSNLVYESFSDGSKSIDLVSHDVLVHDIREKVHRGILLPTVKSKNLKKHLQFEVHYLDTKGKSHLTFLCNQSKILLEFDFLLETFRFISRKEENEYKERNNLMKKDLSPKFAGQIQQSPGVFQKSSPISPVSPVSKKTFEMKVNITESELIVVEDVKDVDTQTVILKTTAVLAYRPDHFNERPVTCSLQSLEVFSCVWSQRENSALSIVDPVAFLVELNSSPKKKMGENCGLLDAVKPKPSLEIQFQVGVNIRLSYHDVQMFMKIINSAQQQFNDALHRKHEANETTDIPLKSPAQKKASNDTSDKTQVATPTGNDVPKSSAISGFEVRATSFSVTLIDDAGNNDVPLLDVIFNNLLLQHDFDHSWKGLARCQLDANYYNTRVSAWEPFIESWRFNVHWCKSILENNPEKLAIKIDAPERLDMNITSAFVDITKQTANLWSSRFFLDATNKEKRRAPFLPFLFRNKTGCKLVFHTIIKSPTKVLTKYKMSEVKKHSGVLMKSEYELLNDAEVAFSFEERTKQRHQTSHQLLVHQIVVQIVGYREMRPLTVDRVGQFFRLSYSTDERKKDESVYVVFEITLEGARKVITVKSALTLHNQLTLPIELLALHREKQYRLTTVDVGKSYVMPLPMIDARLYCRPLKSNAQFEYCVEDLSWREVTTRGEKGFLRICRTKIDNSLNFKFCALINCIGLPKHTMFDVHELSQPEHTITLVHSTVLKNTLPFDLFYLLKGSAMKELLKPGGEVPLNTDTQDGSVDIGFSFENFPAFDMIKITNDGSSYMLPARVYDLANRVLILNIVITSKSGALQICVFSPYWLINKTGLPIVFKREDDTDEIAGQFEEHEEARSLLPLPFSYVSSEYSFHCQMRVGKNYVHTQGMTPMWCKPFSLEKDTQHRTLYLRQGRDRPEKSFDVAIAMKWGKGVFSRTRIITFVPRFQIDNQTTRQFSLSQKHYIEDIQSETPNSAMTCYPGTVSIYHWPRSDLDRIVVVRLNDDASTLWSGGFRLDCETTYHLNIKSTKRANDYFLRVHITYHNGTYVCTLSDAGNFPPPFRIVNLSDVTVFYWQENVSVAQMRTFVKAKEGKNYVLDEPLLPPNVVLSVYQENSQTYQLKQAGKHLSKLYYQNAIFIAFTHTFYRLPCSKHPNIKNTDHHLVLDVTEDKSIVLARKGDHKRSQLWRMNAEGNLLPFASSTQTAKRSNPLVLDVEDEFTDQNMHSLRLVLNPLDSQRSKTQTWYFQSNYLFCGIPGFVVHFQGQVKQGAPVFLCKLNDNIPSLYRCISREKLRPGSGVLSVRAYSNGPTHVLEIADAHQESQKEPWVLVDKSQSNMIATTCNEDDRQQITEITLSLANGIGLSIINFIPEEVLFVTLSSINFYSTVDEYNKHLNLQIGSLQFDNQLYGSPVPVCLFAAPAPKTAKSNFSTNHSLEIVVSMERDKIYDLLVFKDCSVDVCNLYIRLEDRLLLKLIQAIQKFVTPSDEEVSVTTATMFDSVDERQKQKDIKKYFFESITFKQGDLNMSLVVTGKLEDDLILLKKNLGIPLVSFDSAVISFELYERNNVFEALQTLLDHMLHFYKQTFISQAAVLLGSLDILGNPMGLFQDFSSGVEGLLKKGNIGGLFVNVAHGFSDSAAKMTGVIADGLWTASMDNKFQESRDSLRVSRAGGSSSSHFSAGLKGLGMGVIGGLTSMVTQPIEGASKKGVSGFFTGLGKGLVGTVAKPMAGVLDLASGTAAAVRTTTETSVPAPRPVRLRRNCFEHGGVLGKYNKNASEGQEVLLQFNEGDSSEKFVSMELIRPSTDKLKAILTNKGVYFVKSGPPSTENIFLHVEYARFVDSSYYNEGRHHGIEIFLNRRRNYNMHEEVYDDRTMVRAESERIATKVCQKMNYLKSLHEESQFAFQALGT